MESPKDSKYALNSCSVSMLYSFSNMIITSGKGKGGIVGGVKTAKGEVSNCISWGNPNTVVSIDPNTTVIAKNCIVRGGEYSTMSAAATALGWDTTIWDLSGDTPRLK